MVAAAPEIPAPPDDAPAVVEIAVVRELDVAWSVTLPDPDAIPAPPVAPPLLVVRVEEEAAPVRPPDPDVVPTPELAIPPE